MEKPVPVLGADAARKRARRPLIQVPEHTSLGRIGRGSYGEVLLAVTVMRTFRAIKVVYRDDFKDEVPYRRELEGIRRFEPVSRSHEALMDVLQVGHDAAGRYFYYIMELADDIERGRNIDPDAYRPRTLRAELERRKRLPVEECIRLGISLCGGLQQLHQSDLVHRDVKPSNIIFAHGVPKLADIGLVGQLGEARSLVGTAGFIPPEGPGTRAADIYSLGKVLYEASVGEDRQKFPHIPAEVGALPEARQLIELSEIINQACHHDFAKRYPTADAMAEDLGLLLRGKSVRRLRVLERRMRLLTRGILVAVGALALGGVALWGFLRAGQFQAQLRQRQVGGLVADGTHALSRGDLIGALPLFTEGLHLDQGDRARAMTDRLRIGLTLGQCPKLIQLWSMGGEVSDVEFSADGRRLVIGQWGGVAQVYDIASGKPVSPSITGLLYVETALLSPNGQWLLTASQDASAALWDTHTGRLVRRFTGHKRTYGGAFSPDGRWVALACTNNLIRIYKTASGTLKLILKGHTGRVEHVAFSQDGTMLVSASNDGSARIWDLRRGVGIGEPFSHKSWVKDASLSPDGRQLITGCCDHTARVWNIRTGQPIGPSFEQRDIVNTATFSPDGQTILTAGLDGTVWLWDSSTHQPLRLTPLLPHAGRIRHACFSPGGNRIAVGGIDGWVAVWDLAGSAVEPKQIPGAVCGDGGRFVVCSNGWAQVFNTAHNVPVSPRMPAEGAGVRLSSNGHFAVATATNRAGTWFQVWAVGSGKATSPVITTHGASAVPVLNDTGTTLAVFSGTRVDVFDTHRGTHRFAPLRCKDPVTDVVFNPVRPELATAAGDAARLWSLQDGKPLCAPLRHLRGVSHIEFSPNGSYLVTSCADPQLTECYAQVWSAATGAPVGPPLKHQDGVTSASFSPDSQRVVTAGEDRFAAVWHVGQGTPVVAPFEHATQVQDAAFNQNGLWVATGCHDGDVRIWDAVAGVPLGPPLWNPESIVRVRFIDGDRDVVAVGVSGRAWLWSLPRTTMPTSDLLALSEVLDPNLALSLNRGHAEAPREVLWKRLRSKYPGLFSVPPQQLALWREQQARRCEANGAWQGALTHLKCLAALRPGDAKIARWRQEVARKAAAKEQY